MQKFHFRLAALLRLRENTRDERRLALAESQRADAALRERLSQLNLEQERIADEMRAAAGPGDVSLSRLIELRRYADELRGWETELNQRRKALAAEIDLRRQSLLEADREVRTLEKLKETQLHAHRMEEQRREAKQLDEVALQAART